MSDTDGDNAGVPLIEDFTETDAPTTSTKRKREEDTEKPESKRAAKRKKSKSKKPKDVDDEGLDTELGVNHAIARMDSGLLADHIAQRTKRFQPDLSAVEAEDLHLPEKGILDTSAWRKPRTIEDLPSFLEKYAGDKRKKKGHRLTDAASEPGQPHTLLVTSAGQRAADLTRGLSKFKSKDVVVAKLFAKHIKMKEAIETVKQTRMTIGVGTPQRLIDLIDDGAYSP